MFHFKSCRALIAPEIRGGFISSLLTENKFRLHRIYQHPFNQQLFAGTLEQSIFDHYLRDDFLYLHEFSLAIQNIARRIATINPELSTQLNTLAHDIIADEQSMQLKYATHFNHHTGHKMGLAITEYSKYLIDSSLHAELPHALCSILPCFWIYYQLGVINWNSKIIKDNPYHDWIATYSSPRFIKATRKLASTIELIAIESDAAGCLKMHEFFSRSTEFELRFFDEVYPHQIMEKSIDSIRRFTF